MIKTMRFSACVAVCVVLGACSAETQCNSGVEEVYSAYRALHNAENGARKYERAIVQAGMHVNEAQTQQATRNFEGCVRSVKAARRSLKEARAARD
ncbi:MAG: hypothetical protein ACX94A_13120 [Algiphilus sp.]